MRTLKQKLLDLSLQKKLVGLYIIAFFIPLVFITFFTISRMIRIANEKNFQVRETQCDQISANISSKLNEYYRSMYSFSNNQTVDHYFNYTYPDTSSFFSVYPSINTLLTSFRVSNPQVSSFTVYTDNPTFLTNGSSMKVLTEDILEAYVQQKSLFPSSALVINGLEKKGGSYFFTLYQQISFLTAPNHTTLLFLSYPETGIYSLYEHESSDFSVFLTSPAGVIVSSTERASIGLEWREHPVMQSMAAGKVPPGSLTSYDKRLYYTDSFSDSRLLEGWNIYIAISNDQYLTEVGSLLGQSLLLVSAITLLGAALFFLCSLTITRRLNVLVKTMSEIRGDNDLHVSIDVGSRDEIGILARNFKKMLNRIDRLILDVYAKNIQVKDLEIKHKQAELLALQSQINPHFLFNTMQSLSISSYNNNDAETASYINTFCSFLRDCLYWETKCVPLSKELQVVENYLSLQKLRYDNRFEYEINIPSDYHHIPIPKFTLQPIVENAIEHGLWDAPEKRGLIRIYANGDAASLDIIVEDNGKGIDPENLARMNASLEGSNHSDNTESIGIFNTNERLKLFYGPDYGIVLSSRPGIGTRVVIHISEKGEFETNGNSDETGTSGR